jgi:serine/threonine-protein kinase
MSISTERWPRLRDLFHQAIDLDPTERLAFVATLPESDRDLRAELAELLDAHQHAGGELTAGMAGAGDSLLLRVGEAWIGRRVGAYRIESLIGRGGMGAVYLARRVEGGFEQRVAIKLLRGELASDELLRRFHAERRILARLDHPAIARLLDGGATDDGHPYLVLEYVEGESLSRWCETSGPALRERLHLFVTVCDAVAYAHRSLVLHRDLKPDNILVTREGSPKLLDFGVAKLLGEEDGADATLTRVAAPWTPAYASPEQVRGGAVTTASDVYSLGVVFYRLLTGVHPYALEGMTLASQARTVCEVEPRLPSTVALEGGAPLRGDLDAITLKALRKEPEHRYGSVEELALDVTRHLDGRPVQAVQGHRVYRAGKLLRRHRFGFAAGVVIAAALIGGLAATTWQMRRAEVERATAERVSGFLQEMLASGEASWRAVEARAGGGPVTVAEVLDQAARGLDSERDLPQEVELALRATLGQSYATLGQLDQAGPQLERALALARSLHGDVHATTARVLTMLGAAAVIRGRFDESEALLERALAAYAGLPDAPPADVVEVYQAAASLAMVQGRAEDCRKLHAEALAVAERSFPENHPMRAIALAGMGQGVETTGDLDGAIDLYRRAAAAFERLDDPDIPEHADVLFDLGRLLEARGEIEAGERTLRDGIARTERHAGVDSPLLVDPLTWLGVLLHHRKENDAAESVLRRAAAINIESLGARHVVTAQIHAYLATVLVREGRWVEAEPLAAEALEILREYLPGMRHRLAEAELAMAEIHEAAGRPDQARAMWQARLDSTAAFYGAEHEYTQRARARLERSIAEQR